LASLFLIYIDYSCVEVSFESVLLAQASVMIIGSSKSI